MAKPSWTGVALLAALLTSGLALAGCGSSSPQGASGPSEPALSASPSVSASPTPTPTTTSTSTTPTPVRTLLQTTTDPHATPWTDKNADFGWLRSATAVSGGVDISFDRATWLLPDQIAAWNKANPGHQVVAADDYAIGNVSKQLRTFLVRKNAVIFGSAALTGNEAPSRLTAAQLVTAMVTNPDGVTVWLYHQYGGLTGDVVQLEEQFRP
jgi:hypothetical protein